MAVNVKRVRYWVINRHGDDGAPIVFNPNSRTVYVGQVDTYHWDLIAAEPELYEQIGDLGEADDDDEYEQGLPVFDSPNEYVEGYMGRAYPDRIEWLTPPPEPDLSQVEGALGVTSDDQDWTLSRVAWGVQPDADQQAMAEAVLRAVEVLRRQGLPVPPELTQAEQAARRVHPYFSAPEVDVRHQGGSNHPDQGRPALTAIRRFLVENPNVDGDDAKALVLRDGTAHVWDDPYTSHADYAKAHGIMIEDVAEFWGSDSGGWYDLNSHRGEYERLWKLAASFQNGGHEIENYLGMGKDFVTEPWRPGGPRGKALLWDGRLHMWSTGGPDPHHDGLLDHLLGGYDAARRDDPEYVNGVYMQMPMFTISPSGELLSAGTRVSDEAVEQAASLHPDLTPSRRDEDPGGWRLGARGWTVVESDMRPEDSSYADEREQFTHSPWIADPRTNTIYLGEVGVHHLDLSRHHGVPIELWENEGSEPDPRYAPESPSPSFGGWGQVNNGVISVGEAAFGEAEDLVEALERHLGPGFAVEVPDEAWDRFSQRTAAGYNLTEFEGDETLEEWQAREDAAVKEHVARGWRPGRRGKGILADGEVYLWTTDGLDGNTVGAPHHMAVGRVLDLARREAEFAIDPSGAVRIYRARGDTAEALAKIRDQEPRLFDEQDWQISKAATRVEEVDSSGEDDTAEQEERPFVYDPAEDVVYLGSPGSHHDGVLAATRSSLANGLLGVVNENGTGYCFDTQGPYGRSWPGRATEVAVLTTLGVVPREDAEGWNFARTAALEDWDVRVLPEEEGDPDDVVFGDRVPVIFSATTQDYVDNDVPVLDPPPEPLRSQERRRLLIGRPGLTHSQLAHKLTGGDPSLLPYPEHGSINVNTGQIYWHGWGGRLGTSGTPAMHDEAMELLNQHYGPVSYLYDDQTGDPDPEMAW